MTQEKTEIILSESAAIVDAETLLWLSPDQMSPSEVVMAWSVLDVMEKEVMKKRKEAFRQYLFKAAVKRGKKDEKGSYELPMKKLGAKVVKQYKKGKVRIVLDKILKVFRPKPHILDAVLCHKLGFVNADYLALGKVMMWFESDIDPSQGGQAVTVPTEVVEAACSLKGKWDAEVSSVVDEKALEGLVQARMVSLEELKSVTEVGDPTWALVVKKPSAVRELLERSKHARSDPGETG